MLGHGCTWGDGIGTAALQTALYLCACPQKPHIGTTSSLPSCFLRRIFDLAELVNVFMAVGAEGNQILFRIVAALAAKLLVVNLQVRPGSARLASPAVAAQNLLSESFVPLGIKPQARLFGSNPVHEAFSVTSCRKACRCSPGRNLKNRDMDCRSTVGSSFSRFAPARKSAQIISRQ